VFAKVAKTGESLSWTFNSSQIPWVNVSDVSQAVVLDGGRLEGKSINISPDVIGNTTYQWAGVTASPNDLGTLRANALMSVDVNKFKEALDQGGDPISGTIVCLGGKPIAPNAIKILPLEK
jgi:hypothetical protein